MLAALILALSPAPPPVPPVADAAPAVEEWTVGADDWARPRTAASVVALPAVRAAVAAWRERPDTRIAIVHPGGEQGSLWGREIHDWLVALGLAPRQLALRPGGPRDDAVLLRLERQR